MSRNMDPGDRVAYVENDWPCLGTVRDVRSGEYFVAWDDQHESDWFPAHELAVIEKKARNPSMNLTP